MWSHYLRHSTKRAALLISFLAITGSSFGQGVELDNFSVFQHDQEVFLSWVIAAGSTCNGIAIERSADKMRYTEVGYIDGVCGSATDPRPYSYVDPNPLPNQINYYRLELGLQGYSDTRSIEFIAVGSAGVVLMPNPATEQVEMRINNPNGRAHTVQLVSVTGKVVFQQQLSGNATNIDLSGVQKGLYIVRVSNTINDNIFIERLAVR